MYIFLCIFFYVFLFLLYNVCVQIKRGVQNMKSIKYFKYINENNFNVFLNEYGYTIDDVKGYNVSSIMRYRGNILKTYVIYFNDGECEYFKVACFESYNEYKQSLLGFSGERLLQWFQSAHIRMYK